MKEPIDEVGVAVESLLTLAEQYERGQIVPWESIEAISGDRNENRGKYIIGKWRRRMEKERDQVTRALDNVGIRLLTHRETVNEIPKLRQRRAYRQIRRGIQQVATVDESRISDHERHILAAQRVNMAQQRRQLFRSQKEIREWKAMETIPRRVTALQR